MREVLTYSRRGSRFTPRQAAGLGRRTPSGGGCPTRRSTSRTSRCPGCSAATAPLIVEIGSGIGESTVALAGARPDHDVRGVRGLAPGRRRHAGPDRRRPGCPTCGCSASTPSGRWSTSSSRTAWPRSGPSSPTRGTRRSTTSGAWSRRPSRTSPRRRLAPGAEWRLATDWADYAEQMVEVLDAEPLLEGGVVGAVGRAAGDEVRAQGARRGPGDHRPQVRPDPLAATSRLAPLGEPELPVGPKSRSVHSPHLRCARRGSGVSSRRARRG